MKILSLNTWGGRAGHEDFLNFIKKHKNDVDIFCFQETHHNTHEFMNQTAGDTGLVNIMWDQIDQMSKTLENYELYFHPALKDLYGLSMFVKKDLEVINSGEHFVQFEKGYYPKGDLGEHARNIQYVTIETETETISVINFHGLWKKGSNKVDIPERIEQSERILEFTNKIDNEWVLIGDFNLLPDTKSLKMLELDNVRNLVKEFNITSTRSSHYEKPEKFADYCLVTDGLKVNNFEVLSDEISDHLPLLLDLKTD